MKRILVLLILLAGTASADQAAPPIPGTAPAGWKQSRDHAAVVHQGLMSGLPAIVEAANVRVYSYRAPQGGGQVIFSVVDVSVKDDAAAAAFVRERLDELKNTAQMMVDDGGGKARNIHWNEQTDDKDRVVDSLLEWAHDDNGTHSLVRAGWVKLPGPAGATTFVIEEVRAECVLAADQAEALRSVCSEALASMMLPEVAARLPISAQAEAVAAAPTTAAKPVDPPASMTATPPGTQVPARPVVQKTPERDWRPFYVLGALIVLGAALMWTKRRREEYDEEADHKQDEQDAAKDAHEEEQP